ncbi:acyl carrier protein [Streptomyces sp. ZAF1911]|uniref:acyl carrier protein n=1 Tax=unclassified Streptomyces TaxID=2593676 RepID=UPI00202E8945|nr:MULTISPECIES: acyl carrier protein [unclassified Streptomyces]MCM1969091.1 acyl carrier protein [Streptomyces sp. G1]MCX5124491.1 acyl carrier protein [Streptomyces sp. NBC_00347]MCX5297736.1 acyl carrier protein [Streptomyces sp. NBC_00193]MDD9377040.1 acyl carrier protein [Streptomyces sp. ZAF1911]
MSAALNATLTRIVVENLEADADALSDEATLAALDLDSLAIAELVLLIKEETGADLSKEETSLGELTIPALAQLVTTTLDGEKSA